MSPINSRVSFRFQQKQQQNTTYRRIKQFLQFIVQPHLDGQTLANQAHLMWTIFGGEELFATLFDFGALFIEVHPKICPIWWTFGVVHLFQTALHLWYGCCCLLLLLESLVGGRAIWQQLAELLLLVFLLLFAISSPKWSWRCYCLKIKSSVGGSYLSQCVSVCVAVCVWVGDLMLIYVHFKLYFNWNLRGNRMKIN